jgi:hypothetical protein
MLGEIVMVVFFCDVGSEPGGARRCPFGVTDGLRVLFPRSYPIQTVYALTRLRVAWVGPNLG